MGEHVSSQHASSCSVVEDDRDGGVGDLVDHLVSGVPEQLSQNPVGFIFFPCAILPHLCRGDQVYCVTNASPNHRSFLVLDHIVK